MRLGLDQDEINFVLFAQITVNSYGRLHVMICGNIWVGQFYFKKIVNFHCGRITIRAKTGVNAFFLPRYSSSRSQ